MKQKHIILNVDSLGSPSFLRGLIFVASCASIGDDTRFIFGGMYYKRDEHYSTFVCTNGRVIGFVRVNNNEIIDSLGLEHDHIYKIHKFDAKNIYLMNELDGKFPDYEKVIPEISDFVEIPISKDSGYGEALHVIYRNLVLNSEYVFKIIDEKLLKDICASALFGGAKNQDTPVVFKCDFYGGAHPDAKLVYAVMPAGKTSVLQAILD